MNYSTLLQIGAKIEWLDTSKLNPSQLAHFQAIQEKGKYISLDDADFIEAMYERCGGAPYAHDAQSGNTWETALARAAQSQAERAER